MLRGTVAGTYTQRFDILPSPGVLHSAGKNTSQAWTDLGGTFARATDSTGYPSITYPTISPVLTVADESAWEFDTNYRVLVTPAGSTDPGQVRVTAKTVSGFSLAWPTSFTGSLDWVIMR